MSNRLSEADLHEAYNAPIDALDAVQAAHRLNSYLESSGGTITELKTQIQEAESLPDALTASMLDHLDADMERYRNPPGEFDGTIAEGVSQLVALLVEGSDSDGVDIDQSPGDFLRAVVKPVLTQTVTMLKVFKQDFVHYEVNDDLTDRIDQVYTEAEYLTDIVEQIEAQLTSA